MQATHTSPFAGHWYPAATAELDRLLSDAIERSVERRAFVRPGGLAYVVPHAAPMYSGAVAATAYRHVAAASPGRIVLLGFSHRRGVAGIAVPLVDRISTPLGAVEVDVGAARSIADMPPFHTVDESVVCDHSVEIQLPLVQHAAPDAKVLPLYVGRLSAAERTNAAGRLRELLDGSTVLIASSDFTHYGREFGYVPFPVDESTPERLRQLDGEMIDAAGSIDPDLFLDQIHRSRSTVCGTEPIALLLETLRGAANQQIFQETLDYQTSGEITSDYSHCVSYASLGYFPERAFRVSDAAQSALIASARAAIDRLQAAGDRIEQPDESNAELDQRLGVFVTLYQRGELRGCIGCCREPDSLAASVPHLALSAATEDRRFERLNNYEPVEIEISVLSPFKRMRRAGDLIAGVHGGFLETAGHAGLLLPKVASERGWNSTRFLEALALKAGVSARVYDDDVARLSVFCAQVFGDHERRSGRPAAEGR